MVLAVFEKELEPVKYTLELYTEGQGKINPAPGIYKYEEGSIIDIQAIPASGWRFVRWEGSVMKPLSASTSIHIDQDQTVKAVFQAVPSAVPPLWRSLSKNRDRLRILDFYWSRIYR